MFLPSDDTNTLAGIIQLGIPSGGTRSRSADQVDHQLLTSPETPGLRSLGDCNVFQTCTLVGGQVSEQHSNRGSAQRRNRESAQRRKRAALAPEMVQVQCWHVSRDQRDCVQNASDAGRAGPISCNPCNHTTLGGVCDASLPGWPSKVRMTSTDGEQHVQQHTECHAGSFQNEEGQANLDRKTADHLICLLHLA